MSAPAIETLNLTKYYGKIRGIEGLNLSIEKGEIFGYLGPNGAGKTTTIRLLLNLIFPDKGMAKIYGHDVVGESLKVRGLLGYIPSDIQLYPKMPVIEYLDFMASVGARKPVSRNDLLKRFPIELNRLLGDLSSGNKRKVLIVSALQTNPEILLLDEPTLGLDPLMQREFYQLLRELKDEGKTIFLSSHNLPEVEKVCDRVGIVKNGQLAAVENVNELAAKKVKDVEIWFTRPVDTTLLLDENILLVEKNDVVVRLKVKGDIKIFLSKISGLPIEDLVITHASLEDIFLDFYGSDEGNKQ